MLDHYQSLCEFCGARACTLTGIDKQCNLSEQLWPVSGDCFVHVSTETTLFGKQEGVSGHMKSSVN